jgi:hypothetical protein
MAQKPGKNGNLVMSPAKGMEIRFSGMQCWLPV